MKYNPNYTVSSIVNAIIVVMVTSISLEGGSCNLSSSGPCSTIYNPHISLFLIFLPPYLCSRANQELKNGDTYNGRLEMCDGWMNIKLSDVIWTSRDGDRFWKLEEAYIRGSSIKYMTIPDEVLEMVAGEEESSRESKIVILFYWGYITPISLLNVRHAVH